MPAVCSINLQGAFCPSERDLLLLAEAQPNGRMCPVLGTDSRTGPCSTGINKPSSIAKLIARDTLLDGAAARAPTILSRTIAARRELGSWAFSMGNNTN